MAGKSWVRHGLGRVPADPKFQQLVLAMQPDDYLAYVLENPEQNVQGSTQHPLQHRLSMLSQYYRREYRSFRNENKLYIVRTK
jgi:hypothetical protein